MLDFVEEVQRVWEVKFQRGRNPDLTFMAHLWEPLRVFPLPLAMHLGSEAMHLFCHCLLLASGFRAHRSKVTYVPLPGATSMPFSNMPLYCHDL